MRIRRIYFDVDMRKNFEGLKALHADETCALFLNSKRTSFKIIIDKYIVYYRSTRRIPLEAIQHLPATFGGTEAEMNQAIQKSLLEKLQRSRRASV